MDLLTLGHPHDAFGQSGMYLVLLGEQLRHGQRAAERELDVEELLLRVGIAFELV